MTNRLGDRDLRAKTWSAVNRADCSLLRFQFHRKTRRRTSLEWMPATSPKTECLGHRSLVIGPPSPSARATLFPGRENPARAHGASVRTAGLENLPSFVVAK